MNVDNQRRLTYFFGHFPFMAAVIVMLRGVSILLGFTVCTFLRKAPVLLPNLS
jgi:hypothetical protein